MRRQFDHAHIRNGRAGRPAAQNVLDGRIQCQHPVVHGVRQQGTGERFGHGADLEFGIFICTESGKPGRLTRFDERHGHPPTLGQMRTKGIGQCLITRDVRGQGRLGGPLCTDTRAPCSQSHGSPYGRTQHAAACHVVWDAGFVNPVFHGHG